MRAPRAYTSRGITLTSARRNREATRITCAGVTSHAIAQVDRLRQQLEGQLHDHRRSRAERERRSQARVATDQQSAQELEGMRQELDEAIAEKSELMESLSHMQVS